MFARLFATVLIVATALFANGTAHAQTSCSAAAAEVASRPNVRVVAVQEGPNACRIRVIVQRPGRRPVSRVIVVKR